MAGPAAPTALAPASATPVFPAPEAQPSSVPPVVAAAPAGVPGGVAVLRSETVMGTPAYASGDQTAAPVTPPPPDVASPTPAALSATAGAPASGAVMSPITAAPVQPEVTLGRMSAPEASETLPQGTQPVELTPAAATPTPTETVPAVPAAAPDAAAQPAPVSLVTGQAVTPGSAPAGAPVSSGKVVDGFGKQVPLIIALRQILPPEYGFAHRDGVDLTQSVDWQGGRPWQQVLTDALTPVGLKAVVTADTVLIEKVEAFAPAPVAVPTAAAPMPQAQPAHVLVPPASATVTPATTPAPAQASGPSGAAASSPARLTDATIMQSPPQGR